MPRPPAAQRGRKSKCDSAHVNSGQLEVLHAKFHNCATSKKKLLPTTVATRKSKFDSTHFIPGHLEVLHAKFHDRAT